MMRPLLLGVGLSLSLALAAQAQTPSNAARSRTPPATTPPSPAATSPSNPATVNPPASNPPSANAPPASDASATSSPYKAGMAIKDSQGALIGTIARVIKTPDGATTISATVDGHNVNLAASTLTPGADGGVVSSMSKAQITASTAPPT